MLALAGDWVSVVNEGKKVQETKECKNKQLLLGQGNNLTIMKIIYQLQRFPVLF